MDTRSNYHQSLGNLQKELLMMGTNVESQLHLSVEALINLDEKKARLIVDRDDLIDSKLLVIEEECLRLIALQQPMASDLRLIGMAMKIAIDLERIGDHAVDIAKVTIRLFGEELIKPLVTIPAMVEIAKEMLRESLLSYMERDVNRAASLAEKEDEVDKLYSSLMLELINKMGSDKATNRQLTHLIMVAQSLERVADHSTNIGEGVIYMVTGKRKDLNL